jgi:MFS transporter, BCD family, chlorophyll transporter
LAIMPFALILLSGDTTGPMWIGHAGAALAFLLVGAGVQTTQTAGLALATDLAPEESRPRVVALMYVMLLVGMVASGFIFGMLLENFSQLRLIKVVQGAATVTGILNLIALWKQEPRNPKATSTNVPQPEFSATWRDFIAQKGARRFLIALGLGTAAFNMQDIILEPYGGEILGLGVGATTTLTAMMAMGALVAFAIAARWLQKGGDPYRVAGFGVLLGAAAFAAVIFAYPLDSTIMFRVGVTLIGFGGGLFSVGTLTAAMGLENSGRTGLALGAWGAVQACAAGAAIAAGGALRDVISAFATQGAFGEALIGPATGYGAVYLIEIVLLFATLATIGPLVRNRAKSQNPIPPKFGLAEFPG